MDIVVGGLALDKIIRKIRFDIEALQRAAEEQKGLEFSDDIINNVVQKVLSSIRSSGEFAKQQDLQQSNAINIEKLFVLKADMEARCEQVENKCKAEFNKRTTELERRLDAEIKDLKEEVSDLLDGQKQLFVKLREQSELADQREIETNERIQDLHVQLKTLEAELLSSLTAKINDTFSMVDARFKKLDADIFGAISRHTEALATFDKLMLTTQGRLEAVENTYVTQLDLLTKADLSTVHLKADQKELVVVHNQAEETRRKLHSFEDRVLQTHQQLEKDFVSRIDAKAQWILRILRKELASQQGEGTDIGKIRCLVCDQVVPQKPEVESMVFGGAPLTQTVRTGVVSQVSVGHVLNLNQKLCLDFSKRTIRTLQYSFVAITCLC
jgi:hypothetical protein